MSTLTLSKKAPTEPARIPTTAAEKPKPTPPKVSPYAEIPFVTIDASSTLDIDDAIHLSRTDSGIRLIVAISNPTKAIKIDSSEDSRAYLLAATAYARDKAVQPMLPRHISESECSLVAGRDRRALMIDMQLSLEGDLRSTALHRDHIVVAHRLSYEQVPTLIASPEHPLSEMIQLASATARMLLNGRRQKGALALYDLARMLVTDEEGNLLPLESIDQTIGYVVVQEAMILSNLAVARFCIDHDIPVIYRNHAPRLAAPPSIHMAKTIDAWIASGTADLSAIKANFSAIAGKASYANVATGHYGLNLPAYLHVTSPLRRYADLASMRQIMAHLKGQPYPYTKAQLGDMAVHLNEAIERRKVERSDGFAAVTRRHAATALERGRAQQMADHEVLAALKASRDAGFMPQALHDEVIRRMDTMILPHASYNTLVFQIARSDWTEELSAAYGRALSASPPIAMQLLLYGTQSQALSDLQLVSEPDAGGGFYATGSVTRQGEPAVLRSACAASRKKDAEQLAAVDLCRLLVGLPRAAGTGAAQPVATPSAASTPNAAPPNSRGNLITYCALNKLPEPLVTTSGKGPSNAMIFTSVATVEAYGAPLEATALSNTKKDAENRVAFQMMELLKTLSPPPSQQATPSANPNAAPGPDSSNHVGLLQEVAQAAKKPFPVYTITEISQVPPQFRCVVAITAPQRITCEAKATTKKDAKNLAARQACKKAGLV